MLWTATSQTLSCPRPHPLRVAMPDLTKNEQQIQERFCSQWTAQQYPNVFRSHWKDQKELELLIAGLRGIPTTATVLDLPCGTGRLTTHLAGMGFRVIAADLSQEMLNTCQQTCNDVLPEETAQSIEYIQADVMDMPLATQSCDVVLCNRLFHHLNTSSSRAWALAELFRVTRQRVVLSYFDRMALDAVKFRLKHFRRGTTPTDRIPISGRELQAEAKSVGWKIEWCQGVWPGVSPQTYLSLVK